MCELIFRQKPSMIDDQNNVVTEVEAHHTYWLKFKVSKHSGKSPVRDKLYPSSTINPFASIDVIVEDNGTIRLAFSQATTTVLTNPGD